MKYRWVKVSNVLTIFAKEDGFTFVEVIVAMTIMMVGLIPLLSLFGSVMDNYHRSTKATVALNLAEKILEELTELETEDLEMKTYEEDWAVFPGFAGYEYKIKITPLEYFISGQGSEILPIQIYAAVVWVKWQGKKGNQEISLRNYITDKG